MRFFSYDNWLNRTLRTIADCMLLSLLWVITSVPFVTVGAATTALYYAAYKAIRQEESGIWKTYWVSFRTNFKQATLLWLMLAAIYIVLLFSCYSAYLLYTAEVLSAFLFWTVIAILAVFTMWVNYLFPYIARFRDTTKKTLSNCAWIFLLNPIWSILLLALLAGALYLLAFIPMGFIFAPAAYMLMASYFFEFVFKKYLPSEETTSLPESEEE